MKKILILSIICISAIAIVVLQNKTVDSKGEHFDKIAEIYNLDQSQRSDKYIGDLLAQEAGAYRRFSRSLDKIEKFKVVKQNGQISFQNNSEISEVIILISLYDKNGIISQQAHTVNKSSLIPYPAQSSFYVNSLKLKMDNLYYSIERFNKFRIAKSLIDNNEFRYDDYKYLLENSSYKEN